MFAGVKYTFGMKRLALLFLYVVGALDPGLAVAEVSRQVPLSKWQITLASSTDGDREILSAQQFPDQSRRITHPGMNVAVETEEARVTWFRRNRKLYSTTAEVPFGNRYGRPSSDGEVTVFRLVGPADARRGDLIEVEFLGVKARFDVPVSEASSSSARPKISFRLGRDGQEANVAEKTGPYAVDELIKTGVNSNRLTVVMMGDGYRSREISEGKYEGDAKVAMSAFGIKDPWGEILKISNFYLVKVRSTETGADDFCAPDASTPCTPVNVKTFFETSFGRDGTDRALVLTQVGTRRAIEAADKYVGAGAWDAIVVFVNSPKYGGAGGIVATTSMHSDAPEIAVHELGHTIGKLADEYENPYPGYPEKITEYNVDSNGTNPKWSAWLTPGVLLPTPEDDAYNDVVGAFEGARYKSTGVFRPMRNCMMRSIGKPFCPVCQEGLLTKVLQLMNLYDRVSPSSRGPFSVAARARTFKYTRLPLSEGEFRSTWTVCGRVAGLDVNSITISKESLQSRESCKVSLKIDFMSPRLRSYNLSQTVTWTVEK